MLTLLMACSLYQDNATTNAMIMLGSDNNPLAVTVVAADGTRQTRTNFKKPKDAAAYAEQQIQQGANVELGLMQIPSSWLSKMGERVAVEDLFRSCKNVLIGSEILNRALEHCAHDSTDKNNLRVCALSIYKAGNEADAKEYAQQVLNYAAMHPLVNNKLTQPMGDQVNLSGHREQLVLPEPEFVDTSKQRENIN